MRQINIMVVSLMLFVFGYNTERSDVTFEKNRLQDTNESVEKNVLDYRALNKNPLDWNDYKSYPNGNIISLVIKYDEHYLIGLQNGLFKVDSKFQNFNLLFSCKFPQNLHLFGDELYFESEENYYVIRLNQNVVQTCNLKISQISDNYIGYYKYLTNRQSGETMNLMEEPEKLYILFVNLYEDKVYYHKNEDYENFYIYNPDSGEMSIFIHQKEGGLAMLPIFDGGDCYYISHGRNRELHKLNMNTKEDIIVATDVLYSFNAYEGTAYYAKWNEESKDSYICSNKNGVEKILMTDPYLFSFEHRDEANWSDYGSPVVLNIVDDRLFFIIYKGRDRKILTMKTDGTDLVTFDSVQ